MENGSIPDDGKCAQHKGISTHVVLLCNSSAKWGTNPNLGSNFHITHNNFLDPCTVSRSTINYMYYCRAENFAPAENFNVHVALSPDQHFLKLKLKIMAVIITISVVFIPYSMTSFSTTMVPVSRLDQLCLDPAPSLSLAGY